jgi:GT2 family glycosyltransferase
MKISVILVAYNTPLSSDPFFLHPLDDTIELLVVDNSTDPVSQQKNAAYASGHPSLHYFPLGRNAGLSVAYNLAAKAATGDYLLFLDQDTTLPVSFFDELRRALASGADVYCPRVYAAGEPMSPLHYHDYAFQVYAGKGEERQDDLLPISSGTAVKKETYLQVGGFDERYFLDFVDFSFYRACAEKGAKIVLTTSQIDQDFSGTNLRMDKEKALRRFSLFVGDSAHFYRGSKKGERAYRRLIQRRALHLFWIYKDGRFLKLGRLARERHQ